MLDDFIQYELQPLVKEIRRQYPRVRIVQANFSETAGGGVQQNLRFQAPLDELRSCGLLTDEMLVVMARRTDKDFTSLGEGFHLSSGLDELAIPGCHDLEIWTGAQPRERNRLRLTEAQRELKGILKLKRLPKLAKSGK